MVLFSLLQSDYSRECLWLQNPFKNVIIKIESSLMSIDTIDTLYFAVQRSLKYFSNEFATYNFRVDC